VTWKELSNKTGSRNANGDVPNVNWNSDNRKLYVNWNHPDNRNDNLRARSEVSHKKEFFKNSFCVKNIWNMKIIN